MFDIAFSVALMLQAGTRVDVAWVVAARGFGSRDRTEALAITPGGGRVGSLLGGSLNEQLADLAAAGVSRRLVDIQVSEVEALATGLSGGGETRCLLMPAADLPGELWERLRDREPVGIVARLDGDRVVDVAMVTRQTADDAGPEAARLFSRGTSDSALDDETATTVWWPVPKLVIVGPGPIAEALEATARLLGWHPHRVTDVGTATGVIAGLARLDKVVVVGHDHDLAGAALAAALATGVGYIGSVGPRHVQQARGEWLAYRDVTDLTRVHGPAGLDIGATRPAEVAVAVVAEALSVSAATR